MYSNKKKLLTIFMYKIKKLGTVHLDFFGLGPLCGLPGQYLNAIWSFNLYMRKETNIKKDLKSEFFFHNF